MIEFDVYLAITALSGLVIVSYVFSLISARTRIPTVLMLLLLGVGIREAATALGQYVEIPLDFIQFIGVLGLILILLEAGLDLNLDREKFPLIGRATGSAIFVLSLSVVLIALIMQFTFAQGWLLSFIYAAPLAVISSTIVASSISYLSEDKREFLTYESALSDIFGILLFNILVAGKSFSVGMVAVNIGSIALALLLSVIVSVILLFLLARVKLNIKAFLILPVLLLVYSVGHLWQIPTLLSVLIFGLIINNWRQPRLHRLHRWLGLRNVENAAETVKSVTSEAAFLIRTIFFTLFGYTIDVRSLLDLRVIGVGSATIAAIFIARFVYLRLFLREHVLPELFFAPRGLVTIVLYYSIPQGLGLDGFDDGVIFFVVLLTTVIMMIGSVFFTPHHATREGEENGATKNGSSKKKGSSKANGEPKKTEAPKTGIDPSATAEGRATAWPSQPRADSSSPTAEA